MGSRIRMRNQERGWSADAGASGLVAEIQTHVIVYKGKMRGVLKRTSAKIIEWFAAANRIGSVNEWIESGG